MSRDKNALGKGLSALISDSTLQMIKNGTYNVKQVDVDISDNNSRILEVPLENIEPNITQPRQKINNEELQELADSISKHGILQPLLVAEQNSGFYKIIAADFYPLRGAEEGGGRLDWTNGYLSLSCCLNII